MDFSIGPQSGVSWTTSQLMKSSRVVETLGEKSFWVSPSKNAVYGIYLYSRYAFPNSEFPYQLRVMAYAPGPSFLADTEIYIGGVGIDGTINMTETNNGYRGVLINKDQIMWNDGSIWYRTQPPPNTSIDQYSAQSAYAQAAEYSNYMNTIYNRAYPNIYRYIPF